MKVTIPRANLKAALASVKAAAIKDPRPVLSHVHIVARTNDVEFTCTDTNLTLRTVADAVIETKGETTVDAAVLYSLVDSLKQTEVTLEVRAAEAGSILSVTAEGSKYELPVLPVEHFPAMLPIKETLASFTVPQATLRKLLANTSFCQASEGNRPVLMGSLIRTNGAMIVVACDGARVAMAKSPLQEDAPANDIILPARAVQQLTRLLSSNTEDEKPVAVAVTASLARFSFDSTIIYSSVIAGEFPDVKKVLPAELKGGVAIVREELLHALKRVAIVSKNATLEFRGQTLSIKSRNAQDNLGTAVESLLIPKTKDITLGFNAGYLIEALNSIEATEIQFFATKPNSPAVIQAGEWTFILAPLTEKIVAKKPAAKPAPAAETEGEKAPAAPVTEAATGQPAAASGSEAASAAIPLEVVGNAA